MSPKLSRFLIAMVFVCNILPGQAFAQQAYRVAELKDYFADTTKALVIQRAAGRVTDTLATPATGEGAPARVVLRPGDIIKPVGESRTAQVTMAVDTAFQITLPAFLHVDRGTEIRLLIPKLRAVEGGLRYRDGMYRAPIRVALQDSLSPTRAALLDPKVTVKLMPIDAGRVDPEEITVNQTNDYENAEVVAEIAPAGERFQLLAVTPADVDGVRLDIPIHLSKLGLTATPSMLQGFGLETSVLDVTAPPEWRGDSLHVSLVSGRGNPEPRSVWVHQARGGEAVMRSARLGDVSLQAQSRTGFRSDPVLVRYTFPWWFLGAAILGALLGAFLSRRSAGGHQSRGVYLLSGTLVGLLVATAYVVGINLLINPLVNVSVPAQLNEALVFVLAALGAYYGLPGRLKQSWRQ